MMKIAVVTVLAAMSLAAPSLAATDAECQDLWKRADANGDGLLSDNESVRYVALMRVGNRTMATEGRIAQSEFMEDRAISHGVESVTDLKKDDDGIWRGTGTQNGKTVQIAVDYKGNVVTTAQQ